MRKRFQTKLNPLNLSLMYKMNEYLMTNGSSGWNNYQKYHGSSSDIREMESISTYKTESLISLK